MSVYDAYAQFYDGSGHVRFAILMAQYLQEVLARHAVQGRRALDLACGTGTLALILADAGWHVVGVDGSAAMLEIAGAKASNLDSAGQAMFVQRDMRSLWPGDDEEANDVLRPASFDLVACTYDSLNYLLTEADVLACFTDVAQALCPGGLFVGDMNTRHFLAHDWGEHEVVEMPGFIQLAQSTFDDASGCSTMRLTCFVGDDQRGYERFDETHVERAYPSDVIAKLLEAAGLRVEAVYDCFTFQEPEPYTQRLCWIARK
ncbi:MAG TPA: class I SAM-dependent methyltransferase [Roseiflexaceae bacterium]|nr:class I SAM-dependent methyltransferase [Roseiflexaceae bacterium]